MGAIILLRSDQSVRQKMQRKEQECVLKAADRADLWEKNVCFPSWAKVLRAGKKLHQPIKSKLKMLAAAAGYEVDFVAIGSLETFAFNPRTPREDWLFVEIGRPMRELDFSRIRNISPPRQEGYGEWRRVQVDPVVVEEKAKERFNEGTAPHLEVFTSPQDRCTAPNSVAPAIGTRPSKDLETRRVQYADRCVESACAGATFVCANNETGRKLFLLLGTSVQYDERSSTQLREMLEEHHGWALIRKLDMLVVDPMALITCLSSRRTQIPAGLLKKLRRDLAAITLNDEAQEGESSDRKLPVRRKSTCKMM